MNRGEQENLFRQSHTFRLQQDGLNKAHKLHLQNQRRKRGYSQGNIHQLSSNLHGHPRSFGDDRMTHLAGGGGGGRACDDLVLSVLKTPVRDAAAATMLQLSQNTNQAAAAAVVTPLNSSSSITTTTTNFIPPQQLNILPTPSSTHSSRESPTKYQALQAGCSEDELVDDVESAKETTKLGGFLHCDDEDVRRDVRRRSSVAGFKFLRRFRTGRSPKIEDTQHRGALTPLRRRSRGRSHADILDGVPPNHGNDKASNSLQLRPLPFPQPTRITHSGHSHNHWECRVALRGRACWRTVGGREGGALKIN